MASQNQALPIASVYLTAPQWTNPAYSTRLSYQMSGISAGSGATSGKFTAWTNLIVYGATFCQSAIGTSTYTVNGTATTSCQSIYALFVTNTSTTATVALSTTTLGSVAAGFAFISGTGQPGTNVTVIGQGGIGGFYRYALNTLGGTNTSMPWGTVTYNSVTQAPYGAQAGLGGVYMNPGDTLQFVSGTDATGACGGNGVQLEYSIATPQLGYLIG